MMKAVTTSLQAAAFDREIIFGPHTYSYHVRSGEGAWLELLERLKKLDVDHYLIVTDNTFPVHLADEARDRVASIGRATLLTVPGSETAKMLSAVEQLSERAVAAGITRRSCVIALGGGLAGNVAGLFAALQYRGIWLVHVPTTFLAMTDSCLSLKQAVNTRLGKNHLGTFYPPLFVWNDLGYLRTLPRAETQSALCEIIKFVVSICPERMEELSGRLRPAGDYREEDYLWFMDLAVEAKCRVMREDPHEKQAGLVHEYGHTFGHALELLSGGEIPHGFAIGIGMVVEARAARLLGMLSEAEEAAHRELLHRNGAPRGVPAGYPAEDLLQVMRHDNKRGYLPPQDGAVDMVLLDHLGQPHWTGNIMIMQVEEALVREAIESCREAA